MWTFTNTTSGFVAAEFWGQDEDIKVNKLDTKVTSHHQTSKVIQVLMSKPAQYSIIVGMKGLKNDKIRVLFV